jgi:hypothetical protein
LLLVNKIDEADCEAEKAGSTQYRCFGRSRPTNQTLLSFTLTSTRLKAPFEAGLAVNELINLSMFQNKTEGRVLKPFSASPRELVGSNAANSMQ